MFSLKSRLLFQDFPFTYRYLHQIERFEIRNSQKYNLGRGSPSLPPQTPPIALSRASPLILGLPSNLGLFAPSIRASPDSEPQLLKRGCALGGYYRLICTAPTSNAVECRSELVGRRMLFFQWRIQGGPQGAMPPPPNDGQNFSFGYLVIPITDRLYD